MTKIDITPDVHKALKVYQAQQGYPNVSAAIHALLAVREEAQKEYPKTVLVKETK
jgi:hypothetical protein